MQGRNEVVGQEERQKRRGEGGWRGAKEMGARKAIKQKINQLRERVRGRDLKGRRSEREGGG